MSVQYQIEWNFEPNASGGRWNSDKWTVHTRLHDVSAKIAKQKFAAFRSRFSTEVQDCFRLVRLRTSKAEVVVCQHLDKHSRN